MEELDLRRIEFFIFQLFETFLAYLSTMGDLMLHPTRVLDALARRVEPESTEGKADPSSLGATPVSGKHEGKAQPEAPTEKRGPERDGSDPGEPDGSAPSRTGLKVSRWRLGRDAFGGERLKETPRRARFLFETQVNGVPRVCYPGIFALASFLAVILFEWIQVTFISYRYDVARKSFESMQLEVLVLFATLFLLAQFADAFYRKRDGKQAPRQIFALCCYCSGYLVPKHAVPILFFVFEDLLSSRNLFFIGLLQLPFLIGMALFWIFGVRRIYGGNWRGTLRLAMNACIGASMAYACGQLLVQVPVLAFNINFARFDKLERGHQYADALVLGERIRKDVRDPRRRRLLGFRLDRLRYHLLADTLRRLDGVTTILRPQVMAARRPVAKDEAETRLSELAAMLKLARAPLVYEEREFGGDDGNTVLQVGTGGIRLDRLRIPKRPILPLPLAEAPGNLDEAIDALRDELGRNVQQLVAAGDELFTGLHRQEQLGELHRLSRRCAEPPTDELAATRLVAATEEAVEKLFWKMEKQRLACLCWLRAYPDRLVNADVLPKAFADDVDRHERP